MGILPDIWNNGTKMRNRKIVQVACSSCVDMIHESRYSVFIEDLWIKINCGINIHRHRFIVLSREKAAMQNNLAKPNSSDIKMLYNSGKNIPQSQSKLTEIWFIYEVYILNFDTISLFMNLDPEERDTLVREVNKQNGAKLAAVHHREDEAVYAVDHTSYFTDSWVKWWLCQTGSTVICAPVLL